MIRPTTSEAPPAAKGTIIVRVRVGEACAPAIRDKAGSATAAAARCRNCRRGSFMSIPPFLVCLFDHRVGEGVQLIRYRKTEGLRGGEINDKIKFNRLLDWYVAGFGSA